MLLIGLYASLPESATTEDFSIVRQEGSSPAITLLVAESKPTEKDTIIRLIENLLSQNK